MADPYSTNPYLQMPQQEAPSPWMALANLATGIGTGISQGSASGRGWASGLAPGIMYGNQLTGLQQQNAQQQAMKRWQLGMMAQEYASKQQDRMLKERQYQDAANEFAPPGLRVPAPSPTMMSGVTDPAANAISGIESGGRYDAIGPVANNKGQRAYGKYQVMDFNIPVWTAEVLGKALTPQEFLANPQAQEAVFKTKFGQFRQQYGSDQDAASVWFSGRPLTGNTAGPDVNGTTVAGYVNKFNRGLYGGQGNTTDVQTAQAGGPPVVPPQGDAISGQGDAPIRPAQYAQTVTPAPAPPVSDGPPKLVLPPKPELPAEEAVRLRNALMKKTMTPDQARAEKNRIENDLWSAQKDEARTRYQVESEMWRNERSVKAEQARHERDLKEKQEERGDTRTLEEQKRGDQRSKLVIEDENKLRDDFDKAKAVSSYRTIIPMLESAKKAGATRAGDLQLISAFAKTMDPDSSIREQESGAVAATGNIGDRAQGYINMLNGGATLGPETRKALIAELDTRFASIEQSYLATEEAYRGIAERRGLDFDNIRIPIRGGKSGKRDDYSQFAPTQEELTGAKKAEPIRIDMSGKRK
jgi:hypothetical protein